MVFNDQYLKNEKDLLKNYIHDYYYPSDKDNPLWVRASPTELVIRPECNQNCSYCYITQHGKELYPLEKRVDTETINRLCEYFSCQPGDFMSYIDDDNQENFFNDQKHF